jgi:hypothetical protein
MTIRPNSQNFFSPPPGSKGDDLSFLDQFSLPKGMKARLVARAKGRGQAEAAPAPAPTRRASARKTSARKTSARKTSARKTSARKTSRPVQAAPVRQAAPEPRQPAEARRVPIPRPAPPERPVAPVALDAEPDMSDTRPFGGPQARPVDEPAPPAPARAVGPVVPAPVRHAAASRDTVAHDAAALDVAKSVYAIGSQWERTGHYDRQALESAQVTAKAIHRDGGYRIAVAAVDVARNILGRYDNDARRFLAELRRKLIELGVDVAALEPVVVPRPAGAVRPAFGIAGAQPRRIVPLPPREEQMSDLSKLPVEFAKFAAMPGAPTEAPLGLRGGYTDSTDDVHVVGEAWAEVLKLFPVTSKRLGIEAEVRDGTFAERQIGCGNFGTAFSLPDPSKVLKLTVDAADLYVLNLIAKERHPLDGLIHVYDVFRMELPFDVIQTGDPTLMLHPVSTAYGVITETVVTYLDYAEGKNIEPMVALTTPHFGSAARARQALSDAYHQSVKMVLLMMAPAIEWSEILSANEEYGLPLYKGHLWCKRNGITYLADAHPGNFALAWRGDKFVAVKSDLGFRSVQQGIEYARREAKKVPLAANRRRY